MSKPVQLGAPVQAQLVDLGFQEPGQVSLRLIAIYIKRLHQG